jgi:hypothetical protein
MTFDIPLLLRTSFPLFITELKRLNVHFGQGNLERETSCALAV